MAGGKTPKFCNEAGVRVIHVGVKEFECIGAKPPFDHPHVYLDTVVLLGSISGRHPMPESVTQGPRSSVWRRGDVRRRRGKY